jgi:HEAT repeat protein
MRVAPLLLTAAALFTLAPRAGARPDAPKEGDPDEQKLLAAGLAADGPALVDFFRQRARTDADADGLTALIKGLGDDDAKARVKAAAALVGRGAAAVPALRRAANDLGDPDRAARARRCLKSIEGPAAAALPAAAARLVAQRKPAGGVEALLAFLPAADDEAVVEEVSAALTALAYADGKPHPALLTALDDAEAVRRAVAAGALCRKDRPDQFPAVRRLLRDPKPGVRLRAALPLAAADDAEAFPVLIDLLADVPPAAAKPAEELLQGLAGDWAPGAAPAGDDDVARRIRRDAWAAWWKNTDGPALLAEFRKRTPTAADEERLAALITKLGDDDFDVREAAAAELIGVGPLAAGRLREALGDPDAERAARAKECLRQLADKGGKRLPAVAARLLALRRQAGAVEALLAYLPFAEDEGMTAEVRAALTAVAVRDGRPDPALLKALEDRRPLLRAVAAEAVVPAGSADDRAAVRKLLRDGEGMVRVRAALALALGHDKEAVPALIEALADEPSEWTTQAQETLYRLAGDQPPKTDSAADAAGRRKVRDAWAAWWKDAAATADLSVLDNTPRELGYTLLVEVSNNNIGRVQEIGPDRKPRWVINNLQYPVDAFVLGGDRVLIAEYNGRRVSERNFKGDVLWQKEGLTASATNAQRLANGDTFIATQNELLVVDRSGKTVFSKPMPIGLVAAYKGRDGVFTCLTNNGQCVRLSAEGKELNTFAAGRDAGWTSGIDVLPNGHVLISQPNMNTVTEMDTEGKSVWTAKTPGITTATRLANGHTLVASQPGQKLTELDREGKTVWEYKDDFAVFRARRR